MSQFWQIDLFVAADLSTPEVRFLRHELEMIGTPVVFVQASGCTMTFGCLILTIKTILVLEK